MQSNFYAQLLDSLPAAWERANIAALGRVVAGGTPRREVTAFWGGDVPWVTPGEFSSLSGKLLYATRECITESGLHASAAEVLPKNSLLVTTRATLGKVALAGVPVATNQGFKNIVFGKGLHPDFFYHFFTAFIEVELARLGTGTTFPEVPKREFVEIQVPVPPLSTQQRIASILDAADEAIQRTEAVIAKLKLMKDGLLHDLLTRGLDAHGRLRDPIAQPELFKDSPLSLIPKDWEVKPVAEVIRGRPKNGYSPQPANEFTGTLMLGLGCLTTDGFAPLQLKHAPRNDSSLTSALLNNGDLLISRSNTRDLVGLVGRYRAIGVPCIYPDLMMRLVPIESVDSEFLEQSLRSPVVRRQLTNRAVGTSGSMLKINARDVLETLIAMPSIEEQREIVSAIGTASSAYLVEVTRADKLRLQKSGLMHDLLTGRVPVAAAEVAKHG